MLIGGHSDAAFRRTARHGAGWIAGGGGPEMFAHAADSVRAAWAQAGREGVPRLVALAYFALGTGAEQAAHTYLTDYYGFLGEFAEHIAAGALTSPDAVRTAVQAFAAAGCDELILFPCSAEPDQVHLLATTTGRSGEGEHPRAGL